MKILVWGNFSYEPYEKAFLVALQRYGFSAYGFSWKQYFSRVESRLQYCLPIPFLSTVRSNYAFIDQVKKVRPDVILVWGAHHIFPSTFIRIREILNPVLVSYNNDDPFSPIVTSRKYTPWHRRYIYHWFYKSLPLIDMTLLFRSINISEALVAGARRADVMLPYFIPEKDKPMQISPDDKERFGCDVVFIGHYEPDGRDLYIKALIDNGVKVRIYGGSSWYKSSLRNLSSQFDDFRVLKGTDYNKALCSAKMCLCFLSKRNRDTYTRRCFEIPATGGLLLSERTDDLMSLFQQDEEAVFFSSLDELVEKVLWLKSHPEQCEAIAVAGRMRVLSDGHSIDDRVHQFYTLVKRLLSQ